MESCELLLLALPFGVVGIVRRRIVLLALLALVGVSLRLAGHVERGEQAVHALGEGALVEHRPVELVELRAGLAFDISAPKVDDPLGAARRLQAGQTLAHHHRDRLLQRRLVAVARFGQRASVIAVVEHGRKVGGDALHPTRTDRLDARLLDGVEQGARSLVLRRMALVDGVVVAGQPKRHRIGETAQDRRLARIGPARRLGQARLGPVGPGDKTGLVGGKPDLQIGPTRHCARGRGERALERLVGRLGLGAGFAIAGFDVDSRHGEP